MKISAIAIVLCVTFCSGFQTPSFEKQALTLVQNMPASNLDADLPPRPFAAWFNQIVGPQAGIVWQLTECGERIGASGGAEQDLPACTEVIASLTDSRKVIVVISVGTFKKGLTGKPAFFRAVVERDEQFYQTRRLSDVPRMLIEPWGLPVTPPAKKTVRPPVDLPAINVSRSQIILPFQLAQLPPPSLNSNSALNDLSPEEMPPPPQPAAKTASQEPQQVSEGGLRANAITRIKPIYPQSAKMMNAFGEVKVQIMISEAGRVISAKAISGHLALRNAAVDAAYKWVFKPITFNGVPTKAEGMLTFNFMPGDQ